jgi:hypothetical protein
MPLEVSGAIDWAMDQLEMPCSSNATTYIMSATALLSASILF